MLTLRNYNIVASVAHFVCFLTLLILFIIFKIARKKANYKLYRYQITGPINDSIIPPISPNTLSYCSTQKNDTKTISQCTVTPSYEQPLRVSQFNIIYACMAFFILTSVAHALYAWDPYVKGLSAMKGEGFYSTAVLGYGWNPYRWIEYALSASLMSCILGAVQGSNDLLQILFMAGVTAAMQFNGFTVESIFRNQIVDRFGGVNKAVIVGSSVCAWLLFVFLWLANLYAFFSVLKDINKKYKNVIDPLNNKPVKIPGFVYFVVFVQLLNYAVFGFIQLYQIVKNWNATSSLELINFEKIERLYLMLSFAAKLGLAGGVSYGLIFRTKNCKEL